MNKTLLVGFYDYPFGQSACELIGKFLVHIELDSRIMRLISDYKYDWYKEEYSEEERNKVEELFAKYERVIVCEDGCYEVLK